MTGETPRTIALIAQDGMKDDLVEIVKANKTHFEDCTLISTADYK